MRQHLHKNRKILRRYRPPTDTADNRSEAERQGLRALTNNPNIIIKPADKGSKTHITHASRSSLVINMFKLYPYERGPWSGLESQESTERRHGDRWRDRTLASGAAGNERSGLMQVQGISFQPTDRNHSCFKDELTLTVERPGFKCTKRAEDNEGQELHDIHTKRTTVLHALPVYLREDVSGFFRTCTDKSDEPELDGVAVALLSVVSDHDTSPVHYQPVKISVIIESDAVVSLPRFGDAFLPLEAPHQLLRIWRILNMGALLPSCGHNSELQHIKSVKNSVTTNSSYFR
ncbi:hypothetical protein D9C73_000090 [Collichthys lucidus]|uniref:Uncharacterized protein n=1 Tax=Collichthys lucidus TaxID=240159 RepID=A0A4U5TWK7_COLLU|nr:hypothetical protein D9C73_000090 [Collichthys lucidus]